MEQERTIIRLMSIQDYAAVYKLWTETAGMAIRSYDDSEEGIAKFIAKNPNSNFVAIKDGEIIGVILCGIDGRRAYIYHTVVNPAYRRQGVGKRLLQAVMEVAEAEGIHKSGLLVMRNNELGQQFWASQGWDIRNDVVYYSYNNVLQ